MEVRRGTISKNGESLRVRRVDNNRSWYGIHVMIVGRSSKDRTLPFSLVTLWL